MTRRQTRPTVAIIGAGFSGLLTALHLVGSEDGPNVRLIERRSAFGRGAAYANASDEHLLNVRASNMSAFPQSPSDFTDWLAREGGDGAGVRFVTRGRYGAYLQHLLREATRESAAGRLILEGDAAVGLSPERGGWTVAMAMGRVFQARAAVLAVGNLPPHAPRGFDASAIGSAAYFAEPWAADFADLPEQGLVVLLGTGLTMVDVALRLHATRPALKMLAISRRGLQPRRHLVEGPAPEPFRPQAGSGSLAVLRALRARARTADWRCAVDGLRPHLQAVWRDWPLAERRRFLRHLRPWWDVHRHRLAPDVASKLDHLTASGLLNMVAGRLSRVWAEEQELRISWSSRGTGGSHETQAVAVINCTGPNGDLTRAQDPLFSSLTGRGLIRADACGLGLDVDDEGRLISLAGDVHRNLFAIGPITRGAFWEITAVPDIRLQAAQLATTIVDDPRALATA